MRGLADAERIRRFMAELGLAARSEARLYFTGGASAVLEGWRGSTIDVDILLEPETDALLRALPELKERLELNVELVSPADFIPELPGWRDRSRFIAHEGRISYFHYDFYAQALAKIERGHAQDVTDVRALLERGWVERARLRELFAAIAPHLYRYPAVDPAAFGRALEGLLAEEEA